MKATDSLLTTTKTGLALMLSAALILTGCGLVSDSGTDAGVDLVSEDYLAVELLESEEGEEGQSASTYKYATYVIEKGTFETEASGVRTEIYVPTKVDVTAEMNVEEMLFDHFAVSVNDYVEEGDPIAYVNVTADTIKIEETELQLERLKDAYAEAKEAHDESVSEREGPYLVDEYEQRLTWKDWQIEDVRWEQTASSYESQIESVSETLNELKENAAVTAITATSSGFVYSLDRFSVNEKIYNGEYICTLVPTDQVYVYVTDTTQSFVYGQELTFTTESRSGYKNEYSATVVSAPARALYCNLGGNRAYIKVDMVRTNDFGWQKSSLTGTLKKIENVLLVPVSGVTTENDTTFVTAIKADGSLESLPFVSGGSNSDYYWVLSGLDEGTEILLNN